MQIRFVGQPPVQAMSYELQTLRCHLRGKLPWNYKDALTALGSAGPTSPRAATPLRARRWPTKTELQVY